jgi:adenylate kinase
VSVSNQKATTLVIVLIGPPGAGKGNQCEQLASALKIPHISTGHLLRECAGRSSGIGQQVRDFINAGNLVPDSLVMNVLEERTGRGDCNEGFILDGFPRTKAQAKLLQMNLLSSWKQFELRVLQLIVPKSILLARLSSRLICPACGTGYNATTKPPLRNRVCDLDGQALITRADDLASTVLERLRIYEEHVPALINYYRQCGVLTDVDGNRTVREIAADFLRALSLHPPLDWEKTAAQPAHCGSQTDDELR